MTDITSIPEGKYESVQIIGTLQLESVYQGEKLIIYINKDIANYVILKVDRGSRVSFNCIFRYSTSNGPYPAILKIKPYYVADKQLIVEQIYSILYIFKGIQS
jgi:hypothetical protein